MTMVYSMQERELARRVLHFFHDEVAWHCAELTSCECGVLPLESWYNISLLSSVPGLGQRDALSPKDTFFGDTWATIVMHYSALGITHVGDILPALSGMAKRVEIFKPGRYIAGLWEKDIAYLLTWTKQPWTTEASRAQVDGPTFSWIKTRSCVIWRGNPRAPSEVMCKLESVSCALATSNPYGEVSACSIQIRGRVICAHVFNGLVDAGIREEPHTYSMNVCLDDYMTSHAAGDFGVAEWEETRSTWYGVVCLELYYTKQWVAGKEVEVAHGLILQKKTSEEVMYTRLGVLHYGPVWWFDTHGQDEVVTIV